MRAHSPAVAGWARWACGADLVAGRLLVVPAVRRGRAVRWEPPVACDPAGWVPPRDAVLVGCLLQRESFARWLTAPLAAAGRARRVFPSLLDIDLPFALEECAYELVEMRRAAEGTTRGLAVGARYVEIEQCLERYRAAGWEPHLLDQEGLALWTQSLAEFPVAAAATAAAECRVVLYCAPERTTCVFGRGLEFLGAHGMRSPAADHLQRLLRTHFPEPPDAVRWICVGPDAAAVATAEPLNALRARWPGPLVVPPAPEFFLARGLAFRALYAGPLRCNLRTGRLTHPLLLARARREPQRAALAVLATGLLLCGLNLAWRVAVARREAEVQESLTRLARAITALPQPPRGHELLVARRHVDGETARLRPLLATRDRGVETRLAGVLAAGHRAGLTFETLRATRDTLVVHGVARDTAAVEQVGAALGFRTSVKEHLGDGRITFVLTAGSGP